MLSICIPLYNYPNYELINSLLTQIKAQEIPIELIVIDDASDIENRLDLSRLLSPIQYIQLKENVGRAKIRNRFLLHAKHDYLLFIDGDSKIIKNDFLICYLDEIKKDEAGVICGRSLYSKQKPIKENSLRWKYGNQVEAQTVDFRKKNPYRTFMTNNFVIRKKLLEKIPFEESLTKYGHEDTLMGFRLEQEGVAISHIQNPVLNSVSELNSEFIKKSKAGIENLIYIYNLLNQEQGFVKHVKLLSGYFKLNEMLLTWVLKLNYKLFGKPLEEYFNRGGNNLWLFTIWKLCYLSSVFKT